jgi:hypothetical protein
MRPQTKETRSVVADVLNDQMEKFLKRLESQGYAPSGVVVYRRRLNEFCDEVKARGVPLEQLDEKRALELFAAVEQPAKPTHARFMVRNFIRFLIEQGVVKLLPDNSARACLKRDYEQYLRRQRGLSERTTASRDDVLMDAAKRYRVDAEKLQKTVAKELATKREKKTVKAKTPKTVA